MSRSIPSWLRHLFWRAEPLAAATPSDGLTIGLSFVGRPDPEAQSNADLWLDVTTLDEAVRLLCHLARLGTADRVLVIGTEELPPHARRRLGRSARQQRRLGLVVELQPEL